MSVSSKEWPVVIALQPLLEPNAKQLIDTYFNASIDSKSLYLAMSRARVKCTVIMFPSKGKIFEDSSRMCSLLDKLKDYVEVRYHLNLKP